MGWSWRNQKTACAGSVLFRGSVAPRADEFGYLARRGFDLSAAGETNENAHWALKVRHPQWGTADVVCMRTGVRPPRQLIDFDPTLTRAEREAAYLGQSTVSVIVEGERADVLRDRKTLLRFLRAIMGDDGVVAVDHTAQRFWPPEALDDEIAHDADLDVESLYTIHDAMNLARHDAADVFSIYIGKAGGIGPARKIAAVAEAAGLVCTLGSNLELGVGSAAMTHLAMATASIDAEHFPCDIIGPMFYEDDVVKEPLPIKPGSAMPNEKPGLGVELDDEKIERYRVK